MKISDIYKEFKVVLDKNSESVSYGGCPAFLPEEEEQFLNQAYLEVISNKFNGTSPLNVPFEGNTKRTTDLQRLVKTDKDIPLSLITSTNKLQMDDFVNDEGENKRLFFIKGILKFGSSITEVKLTSHDIAQPYEMTYANVPWIETPVCVLEDNKLIIYIDPYNMKGSYSLDLMYLAYPTKLDYTEPDKEIDEVPDSVLHEVVNRASVIALENIESQRVSTKVQINNSQE